MQSWLWKIRFKLEDLFAREDGQDLVEYALVIALVSVAAVATLHTMANKITATFTSITGSM
ncbi:MAG: Flp family type IVb pilin [Terracidiphilus sp.]|jgi:Flp pilus assembly pilin Flp